MHRRLLACALATSLLLAASAEAQTSADPAPAAPSDSTPKPPAKKRTSKKSSSKKKKKSTKTAKSSKRKSKKSKAQAVKVAPPPVIDEPVGPPDFEPPTLSSTSVTSAIRGKSFTVTAHATDDVSGVWGPVFQLRKKGMGDADYIPMRMLPAKSGVTGDYSIDVPAPLTNVDGLEYFIEVWDNAGNGPIRYGSPDAPVQVKMDEEKVEPVKVAPKGAPPAITHTALAQALQNQPVELDAHVAGEGGVSGATVMFRHVGEKDFKSLPMGNIRTDEYAATVPASVVSSDLEYYIEAFDKYGNGPARSGSPTNPYRLAVSAPVKVAPTREVAMAKPEDMGRETVLGFQLDAGVPGGGGFNLLVRPLWWLRLNGGVAYNVAGVGYRGGISLAPCWCAVTPTLNIDAGHFASGNLNKLVSYTNSDPNVQAAMRSLFSSTNYTWATAQIGLEFGSQRWFNFYIRGGLQYIRHSFTGSDAAALAQSSVNTPDTTFSSKGDLKLDALLPTASLGFNFFVY